MIEKIINRLLDLVKDDGDREAILENYVEVRGEIAELRGGIPDQRLGADEDFRAQGQKFAKAHGFEELLDLCTVIEEKSEVLDEYLQEARKAGSTADSATLIRHFDELYEKGYRSARRGEDPTETALDVVDAEVLFYRKKGEIPAEGGPTGREQGGWVVSGSEPWYSEKGRD